MAETIKLPKQVYNGNWQDDIAPADYAIYGANEQDEMAYVSPDNVSQESIDKIKARQIRLRKLGQFALFVSRQEREKRAA